MYSFRIGHIYAFSHVLTADVEFVKRTECSKSSFVIYECAAIFLVRRLKDGEL